MNFSSSKVVVMATTLFMFLCTCISIAQPSDGIKPVTSHNWSSHPMGNLDVGSPESGQSIICVQLQEGNILHLNLYIHVKDPNLANYPPMAFEYWFYIGLGQETTEVGHGLTPIANQMLLRTWYDNGEQFHTMVYSLQYDCSDYCPANPAVEGGFAFTLRYQLKRVFALGNHDIPPSLGDYNVWEYSDYNELWPTNFFAMPISPGIAPETSETKSICCYHKGVFPIVMNGDGNTISTGSSEHQELEGKEGLQNIGNIEVETPNAFNGIQSVMNSLTVQPNPFQGVLGVNFKVEKPGLVRFECLDAQGKPVKSFAPFNAASGSHTSSLEMDDVPPGLYFLRMLSEDGVSVVKIVRSGA